MTDKYIYIGPDGADVNQEINDDRSAAERGSRLQVPDSMLEERKAQSPNGPFTATEYVKALGMLEARKHEGR
jgi:hypothetical protein